MADTRNLFQRADAFVRTKRKQIASCEGKYVRAETELAVSVTVGRSAHDQISGDGPILSYQSDDFLIDVADLAALGPPRRGDVVKYLSISGEWLVYEVLPVGGDECFRYADGSRSVYRIHGKLFVREDTEACLTSEEGEPILDEDGGTLLLEEA